MPSSSPNFNFDGPIGGEAWQHEPRQMPYDRPAQFNEVDQATRVIFKRLARPGTTKKLLSLAQAEFPIDMIVSSFLMTAFQEGIVGAPIVAQLAGPITVMIWRMCESAGIKPVLSQEKNNQIDFDPADLYAAEKRISNNTADKSIHGNEISQKELVDPKLVERQGFMKFRPKGMLGSK